MESGEKDLLSKQAILNLPRDKEFNLEGKLLAEYINVKDIEALPTVQSQSTAGQLNDSAQSTNLIDRQQAIDGKILIQRTNGVEIYSDEAVPVGYLKNLPSVQPEPQWIPCEERLPEKTPLWETVGYLATVTCDSWEEPRTMYVKWETTTVRGKEVSRWTFDNRLFPSEWRVVAWMPMPEAYKEGGERI